MLAPLPGTRPLLAPFAQVKREWEQGSSMPSHFRMRGPYLPSTNDRGARGAAGKLLGGEDLRTLLRQAHTLRDRLATYRPKVGAEFTQLISLFSSQYTQTPVDTLTVG
jgi:hypothetical protein